MAVWKLDLHFQALKQGWTETYYADFGVATFDQVAPVATKLATLRVALSANPVVLLSYSLSDPLTEGQQGETFDYRPPAPAPVVAEGAGDPATSVNVLFRSSVEKRSRKIFMRGVPDNVITDFGQIGSVAFGVWEGKFNQLRDFLLGLVNGQAGGTVFGWLARKRITGPTGNSVVGYEYPPDTQLPLFSADKTDFFPADQVNTKQYVRVSGLNGGSSVLNGDLVVRVLTRTTFQLLKPKAAFLQTAPGVVQRYQTVPEFVGATSIVVKRAGTRRPGAPFLQQRGRARARARG